MGSQSGPYTQSQTVSSTRAMQYTIQTQTATWVRQSISQDHRPYHWCDLVWSGDTVEQPIGLPETSPIVRAPNANDQNHEHTHQLLQYNIMHQQHELEREVWQRWHQWHQSNFGHDWSTNHDYSPSVLACRTPICCTALMTQLWFCHDVHVTHVARSQRSMQRFLQAAPGHAGARDERHIFSCSLRFVVYIHRWTDLLYSMIL